VEASLSTTSRADADLQIATITAAMGETSPPDARGADREEDLIMARYESEAREHGHDPSSTMLDETTRNLESRAILTCVEYATRSLGRNMSLLEVGCGNGYMLQAIRDRFSEIRLNGVDLTPQMVELAEARRIANCELRKDDVRNLGFPAAAFDVVLSERCLINLLDPSEQEGALAELRRVLAENGYLIVIEAFTDGLENLNRARTELGLAENVPPTFNRWLDETRFRKWLEDRFAIETDPALPPENFLSTHYFVSRVVYPAITKREVLYNTEFVKFFRFLPAQGDYAPIRLYLLRRLPG
jgi:ubiquinone/menaquinone biosynthesis C-methylase UbiE